MLGGAQVSPKHSNFLINTGTATSAEIEALGEEVRARVKAKTGIELEWEIQRVGQPADAGKTGQPADAGKTGQPADAGKKDQPADAGKTVHS
jgi:hypothetical protein